MFATTVSIFGLVLARLSFAQTTTRSLFVPGADPQSLIGSIIGSVGTLGLLALSQSLKLRRT
jgi:hypothetical protein